MTLIITPPAASHDIAEHAMILITRRFSPLCYAIITSAICYAAGVAALRAARCQRYCRLMMLAFV